MSRSKIKSLESCCANTQAQSVVLGPWKWLVWSAARLFCCPADFIQWFPVTGRRTPTRLTAVIHYDPGGWLGWAGTRSKGRTMEHENFAFVTHHDLTHRHKGATTWGDRGGPDPPTFYVAADCSPRNWVYHPYFVLYNNLDQGIGPPTLKTWLRPCTGTWKTAMKSAYAGA